VKQVRVGRQLNSRTRVVLDLNGAGSHSVYAVYNPYRIVIDIERPAATAASVIPTQRAPIGTRLAGAPLVMASNASKAAPSAIASPPSEPAVASETRPAPSAPPLNSKGGFSIARQLGLGVTRIVIDPGMAVMILAHAATASPRPRWCWTWPRASRNC
jgi:N-acetylmuramoyl-L-alanine amidase